MDEVLIRPADLDKAAEYLMLLQGDAVWERISLDAQDRHRAQVVQVLNFCGLTLPGCS